MIYQIPHNLLDMALNEKKWWERKPYCDLNILFQIKASVRNPMTRRNSKTTSKWRTIIQAVLWLGEKSEEKHFLAEEAFSVAD